MDAGHACALGGRAGCGQPVCLLPDGILDAPATLTMLSPAGREMTFRKEDDGVLVWATARRTERYARVNDAVTLSGWRCTSNVRVVLRAECPGGGEL